MSKSLDPQDTQRARDVKAGRESLYEQLTDAVRAFQRSVDVMDETACAIMGINRTDARAMDLLQQNGPLPAGRLAEEAGLTSGGTTAVIDRLEKAGYVRRKADPGDRRKVVIEATEKADKVAAELYGPLGEGRERLEAYGDREIQAMIDFLRIGIEVTDRQSAKLRETL
jgi:DNA-binding MarR family transcriptional regulator